METIFYHLHCLILIVSYIYGHYRMLRYKDFKLCLGPHFVISGVHFVLYIIYGTVSKQIDLTVPGYLAVSILYLWSYLIYSK